MGVTKQILSAGNSVDKPKQGDTITMEYTGWLHDTSKPDNKGKQFDSSVGRSDFKTPIGVGRVIKGWDEGVLNEAGGMSLGEKATLTITGDYAYGPRGFPDLIPPNATLVFDVQLKAINDKKDEQVLFLGRWMQVSPYFVTDEQDDEQTSQRKSYVRR